MWIWKKLKPYEQSTTWQRDIRIHDSADASRQFQISATFGRLAAKEAHGSYERLPE